MTSAQVAAYARAVECPACGLLQNPGETCAGSDCKESIEKLKSPFAGFRFHDLRHQAITELAESKASDSTIMSIAGTSRARCSRTTPTSGWTRSETRWTR